MLLLTRAALDSKCVHLSVEFDSAGLRLTCVVFQSHVDAHSYLTQLSMNGFSDCLSTPAPVAREGFDHSHTLENASTPQPRPRHSFSQVDIACILSSLFPVLVQTHALSTRHLRSQTKPVFLSILSSRSNSSLSSCLSCILFVHSHQQTHLYLAYLHAERRHRSYTPEERWKPSHGMACLRQSEANSARRSWALGDSVYAMVLPR